MNTNRNELNRRELLAAGGAAAALAMLGSPVGRASAAAGAAPAGDRKRVLRLAHLTDIHVQPERRAAEGLAACLRHVQAQADRPELILTGGDLIMDSMGANEARTRTQWDVFAKVFQEECRLPVEHCIGNHDVWGWDRKDSATDGSEARWGKKWVMEQLGLARPYRSFDRAGWHFIVLDSTFPKDDGYTARLDDEQFEWLAGDLAKTDAKTPVLVLSHIPILAACTFFDGDCEKSGDWQVPGAWMHVDARRIKDLFRKHPNVKLCLSGHIHLVDRVDYLGVTYLCNGAVCGGWWKGPNQEFSEGYGLVNLFSDGTLESEYVTFGWKAETQKS